MEGVRKGQPVSFDKKRGRQEEDLEEIQPTDNKVLKISSDILIHEEDKKPPALSPLAGRIAGGSPPQEKGGRKKRPGLKPLVVEESLPLSFEGGAGIAVGLGACAGGGVDAPGAGAPGGGGGGVGAAVDGSADYTFEINVLPKLGGSWVSQSLDVCRRDFQDSRSIQPVSKRQSSGAYFVHIEGGEPIAILKPLDEELGQVNAHTSTGAAPRSKDGVEPGTSGLREVLAHNLFPTIVPSTALVTVSSKLFNQKGKAGLSKQCAMQKIVPQAISLFEIGSKIPAGLRDQLVQVAMVDICLANADRNRGNILVQKGVFAACVPIDHGCILPSNFRSGGTFAWYDSFLPEERFSSREVAIINGIDLAEGEAEIRALGFPEAVLNTYAVSILVSKKLCEATSIREIAMYHLAAPSSDGFVSKSIMNSILRMSALRQDRSIDLSKQDIGLVRKEHIESVIDDVVGFIEGEGRLVEDLLDSLHLDEDKLRDLKESLLGSSQKINIVHRIVRNILSDAIEFNPIKIIDGSWKDGAHSEIVEALKKMREGV